MPLWEDSPNLAPVENVLVSAASGHHAGSELEAPREGEATEHRAEDPPA
jgi:hypothetical protein